MAGRDATDARLVSVVVPVFCEEAVLEHTYAELTGVMRSLAPDRYELIFVDDGSSDGSRAILARLAAADRHVKVVGLSRNFGHQVAITAGMRRARGDAIVTIDADLQDPPSLIPRMLELWRAGNDVVLATRTDRQGETWFKKTTATLFYRLLNRLAGIHIPQDTGDFRLLDRRVADELNRMAEHNRFVRGLVSWVGFRQTAVGYVRNARRAGSTKYALRKMVRLAWDGIISFSDKPLRLAMNLGFCAIVVAFAVLAFGLVQYWRGDTVRGWTSTIVTVLFLGGVQLFTLGIIGEYLSRMHDEIKGRPLYVVQEELNFDDEPDAAAAPREVRAVRP
jgi:dolichol-phosphate mannosyltransferase